MRCLSVTPKCGTIDPRSSVNSILEQRGPYCHRALLFFHCFFAFSQLFLFAILILSDIFQFPHSFLVSRALIPQMSQPPKATASHCSDPPSSEPAPRSLFCESANSAVLSNEVSTINSNESISFISSQTSMRPSRGREEPMEDGYVQSDSRLRSCSHCFPTVEIRGEKRSFDRN